MNITIIDQTICKTDSPKVLKDFLKVTRTFWRTGQYNKEKTEYEHPLVGKDGSFLAGFLPRVIKECERRKIPLTIKNEFERVAYDPSLTYPKIRLFDDQQRLVATALENHRGIIQSPTGTGKTILCYAMIYPCMPCRALVICPSKSIMTQTAKKFEEEFGLKTSVCGGGQKDLSGDVVVSLINTLNNLDPKEYCDVFDIVIVDEAHHAASFDGMYHNFLTNCLAPIRIGLTATVDKANTEKGMAAEGLLGPVIGKFTFQEAVEAKRIAKPVLKLLPTPINSNIQEMKTYKEIYDVGVVFNRQRNSLVVDYVAKAAGENKTSIVFVRFLNHAELLVKAINAAGVTCTYVSGSVSDKEREETKIALSKKTIKCVVATSAWREGVDVPNLDIVVNAAGYLSEKAVLQMAGRAFRIAEGKSEGIFVDFIDSGKYLGAHCIRRLLTYSELDWI